LCRTFGLASTLLTFIQLILPSMLSLRLQFK